MTTTMTSGPFTAWLIGGSVLTAGAMGWGAFNVVDLLAHEVTTETQVFPADGLSLIDLSNSNGRVVVTGTDADEITVVARVSDGLRATGNAMRVVGDRLEIRGTCPALGSTWCSVDYRIELPRDLDLDIDADDGRVEVVDVTGTLTIDSDNGSLEIRGAEGPIRATTDNGSIEATSIRSERVAAESDNGSVEVSMVVPPQHVDVSSNNGRVEVVLPDTPDAYAVTTHTDNGEVRNTIRTDPTGTRTIEATTDNGDVTLRYAD
jgi:hypothetical protein